MAVTMVWGWGVSPSSPLQIGTPPPISEVGLRAFVKRFVVLIARSCWGDPPGDAMGVEPARCLHFDAARVSSTLRVSRASRVDSSCVDQAHCA
ncbi:hypothetical protein GLA29479_4183 [Lysobacter antibioticus]|uniref:hypothetical protein n=1 Tax=Lysobacter antibioticus TaxID=84531 RepID=UPI000722B748|nr:hypothetical protein [Lysobacter antibioticus]ALN65029.1 hypothetical protein GLA29479_4183 [Lysobacter antibioticus]